MKLKWSQKAVVIFYVKYYHYRWRCRILVIDRKLQWKCWQTIAKEVESTIINFLPPSPSSSNPLYPTSSTSSTSSTYSSSSCASDSEGEDGFHPGRFGLEDGEMRSFQLDDEDYPDTVKVGGEEEKEGENKEDLEGEKNFLPSYSSSTPPPPPTPIILPTSLRLSPILRSRRSSLPQI